MKPLKLTAVPVPKAWGGEMVICNNEEFCGKLLTVRAGRMMSLHFHASKREVFAVWRGKVELNYLDTTNAEAASIILEAGDIYEIPRLLPHRLIGIEDAEVWEFSTHHEDADSFRVAPGDSQK